MSAQLDDSPDVLSFAGLLEEFEAECQAILPRERWLWITNRSLSPGCEEEGEALLVLDCARWLAEHTFNKLIYIGGENVLWYMLCAVRTELNHPTTKQTVAVKMIVNCKLSRAKHEGAAHV